MAFTNEDIRKSYLEDITKWCPKTKKHGVWQNSVRKSGNVPKELIRKG
jgi:hypothetical protein